MTRLFAVIRARGPAWNNGQALEGQVDWPAHARFMDGLVDTGLIALGGPLEGTRDVLLIFRAGSETEITECLATDPWSKIGLLVIKQIHPWQIRLGSLD